MCRSAFYFGDMAFYAVRGSELTGRIISTFPTPTCNLQRRPQSHFKHSPRPTCNHRIRESAHVSALSSSEKASSCDRLAARRDSPRPSHISTNDPPPPPHHTTLDDIVNIRRVNHLRRCTLDSTTGRSTIHSSARTIPPLPLSIPSRNHVSGRSQPEQAQSPLEAAAQLTVSSTTI